MNRAHLMMPQHFPDIRKVVSCAYLVFPLFWSKRATKEEQRRSGDPHSSTSLVTEPSRHWSRLRQLRSRFLSNTHHDFRLTQFISTASCSFIHQRHHGSQYEIYPSGNARLLRRAKHFILHTASPILPGQPISSRSHEFQRCP